MRRFGADHHDLSAPPEDGEYGKDEIGCLDEQFDHMAHQICELIDKNYVNELLRKDAELEALEKQMKRMMQSLTNILTLCLLTFACPV